MDWLGEQGLFCEPSRLWALTLGFSELGLPGADGPLGVPVGGDGSLLSWPHLPSVGAARSVCFILLSCTSLESCHLYRVFATEAVWAEGFSGSKEKPVL